MSARVVLLALLQVGAVALIGRALVATIASHLDRDRDWLGAPERWLLAIAGFVAFASTLMLGHMATGGRVFDRTWIVPVIAVAFLAVTAWRSRAIRPRLRISVVLVVLGMALIVLFALPALRGGSGIRTGDSPWHLGWTHQVLGGDARPSGPAPEPFARNAYPWGYHAVLATMVRVVPGSDASIAYEAMHFVLIAALPLGAACLARVANRRAGPAAAAAVAFIGGFGWISAGAPDFITSPRDARYGADLVVASPNSLYQLLPPPLPRELGLVLLAMVGVLLAALVRKPSRGRAVAAGAVVGLVGLVSVPLFVSAAVWTIALGIAARRSMSLRTVTLVGGTALAVCGAWAAPVLIDYVRYDGFTAVSPRLGVEWDLLDGLAAWGLLLPLGVGGLILVVTQPAIVRRPLLAYGASAVILLALAWLRARVGWDVFANETLLHPGRYWPALHLVTAAFGGIALTAGYGWLRNRSRRLGIVAVAVVLGIGAISPVYASIDLTRTIRAGKDGFLYGNADYQHGSFVRRAADDMEPDDVMLVRDDDVLAFFLWQFSGARIADDELGTLEVNPWRIRYRDLARRWHDAESRGSFDVDWVFSKDVERADDEARTGTFRGEVWRYSWSDTVGP